MTNLLQDLRYYLRHLTKSPGFTLTAVLSMALGIGATTAVFSVIFAIVMNPYPYKAADRMVHMTLVDLAGHENWFQLTSGQWQVIKKSPVVEDAFAQEDENLTLTGNDLPEDVNATYLSSNTFNFLGVPAALGRGLLLSDAVNGQDADSDDVDQSNRFDADQIGAKRRKTLSV
jgi:putative ABC transport system permease protein